MYSLPWLASCGALAACVYAPEATLKASSAPDASDLMSEAPGSVDEKQLEELGIAIVKSEDSEE